MTNTAIGEKQSTGRILDNIHSATGSPPGKGGSHGYFRIEGYDQTRIEAQVLEAPKF